MTQDKKTQTPQTIQQRDTAQGYYQENICPEEQIPPAPLSREGSVSGARKGPRLPALGGYWGGRDAPELALGGSFVLLINSRPVYLLGGSAGSSLNKATPLRLPVSANKQTNKQPNYQEKRSTPSATEKYDTTSGRTTHPAKNKGCTNDHQPTTGWCRM